MENAKPFIALTAKTGPGASDSIYSRGQLQDVIYRYYAEAVIAAGGLPVVLPACLEPDQVREALARMDGLLLTGGEADLDSGLYGLPRHPESAQPDFAADASETAALEAALKRGLPVLGICRGLQLVNVLFGGTLHRHLPEDRPGPFCHEQDAPLATVSHPVALTPGSVLEGMCQGASLAVNSFHHQGVDRLGGGLRVSATAPDGLVEGVEWPEHPYLIGVQWHPEGLYRADPAALALFQGLVGTARGLQK